MAFDPKALFGSQAFALAGGIVIGMGIYTLIRVTIENLVQPLFHLVIDGGMVTLSRSHGIYLGCAGWLGACLVFVICLGAGVLMVKASSR